jgi:hypothetical protein
MNKASLRFSILIALSVFVLFGCKKNHPLNTYPANSRLLNVTRESTKYSPLSIAGGVVNENYRFVYDNLGRVSQIFYSTNDISKSNTISNLIYKGDTILDRITFVNNVLSEQDTFITDLHGHITKTYIQGSVTSYQYYGDLLTRVDYNDGTFENFTSYNGNFTAAKSSLGTVHDTRFTYFTDKPNRAGDYFHLVSMFRYGYNLFQNQSLVSTITIPTGTTTVNYVIDGDSKVTKTTANVVDTSGYYHTDIYDLQYEKY